jgi:hypothetical protein
MISKKPYAKHIIKPYFALDTNHSDAADVEQVIQYNKKSFITLFFFQIDQLKQTIEQIALNEPYIGEQIPTRWLEFENDLNRLKKQQENFYASLDQVRTSFSPPYLE